MKPTTLQKSTMPAAQAETLVLKACQAAASAETDYAQKAIIAGHLLNEYRRTFCPSHSETGRSNAVVKHNQYSSTTFIAWMEARGIAKPTAYRWMAAAEAVARGILRVPAALPFDGVIDVEGVRVPISQALTAPEAELPEAAREFRQAFFEFMADKTLAEATRAALEGESPASRIKRAAAGKLEGGTKGEDRKDWPEYIGRALRVVSGHLEHWKAYSSGQKETVGERFALAIERWPAPLLEQMQKAIKTELGRR